MITAREIFMHRWLGDGRVTLCAYIDPDSRMIDVGVALCSPKDRFSRKIGRAIASGRRKKCPAFGVELTPGAGSTTHQIEACFRAWLFAEYGDRGATFGDDKWIELAVAEVRRDLLRKSKAMK